MKSNNAHLCYKPSYEAVILHLVLRALLVTSST